MYFEVYICLLYTSGLEFPTNVELAPEYIPDGQQTPEFWRNYVHCNCVTASVGLEFPTHVELSLNIYLMVSKHHSFDETTFTATVLQLQLD